MIRQGDGYALSSGRTIYANHGLLSIGPDLDPQQGYDGALAYFGEPDFTKEERQEIALFAASLWMEWANTQA